MPKIRKETIDDIIRLGEEGYTNTEIGEKLGVSRGTARKYRTSVGPPILGDSGVLSLGDGVLKVLFDLQGILGASSIADAVERAYRDEISAAKFKVNLPDHEVEGFTIEGLIKNLTVYIEDIEHDLKVYQDGYCEDLETIANLKEEVQASYDEGYEAGKQGSAIYFRCAGCGGVCLVTPNGDTHWHIIEMLAKDGWGHASCLDKR